AAFLLRRTIVLPCGWRACAYTSGHDGDLRLRDVGIAVCHTDGESNVVLMHQNFIALALLIATLLVARFFAYIYSIKRQSHLILRTAGWVVFGAHFVVPALAPWTPSSRFENALDHW